MPATHSRHALERSQQRGIPPLIQNWLLDYGAEVFDGRGCVVRYFSRRSIRRLERDMGSTPLRRLSEYLRCYLVESNDDGTIVTVGKRYPNRRLPRQ